METSSQQVAPEDGASYMDIRHELVRFSKTNNLMHQLEVFEKAATIIHGDEHLEHISNITSKEIQALQNETRQKWSQSGTLYFTIFICSIGAIEQGMAQTSMNGANLYFPNQLGIGSNSPRDEFLVGLINGGIYFSVAVFGAWLSEPLNNCLGRRGAIFIGSLICLAGNIASALSPTWWALLAFRFLLGAGLGINTSTINVFAAECAPLYIRGGLAVSWQMFTAFGIFLGFVANVAVFNFKSPWRFQLAFPFIPALLLTGFVFICPESPAWLMKRRNRYDLAFYALKRLRNTDLQAAMEVYSTYLQSQPHKESNHGSSYMRKLTEIFTIPRIRRATIASYTVMLSQQLCGINVIAFYSSSIFLDAGFSAFNALLASTGFGFLNFIAAFPAVWTMDTLGRRTLLLLTLPLMTVTMFGAALSFKIPKDDPAHFGLLAAMIYLFCVEYSPGMGPVPVAYSAEIFPISHRQVGMSFAVSVANIWASILSLTFPHMFSALGSGCAFSVYAVLNAAALMLVFLFVRETKMRTLDELDKVFSVSSQQFARYQIFEYSPWWIKRYVLRQKHAELKPLQVEFDYTQIDQHDENS